MAYNSGFPMGYQQMYPQYQSYPQYQQVQSTSFLQQPISTNTNVGSGVIWVQGEAGAKSYMVAPNTTAQLWDSEQQVIYLKSADASGMPSMKILDYTIRDEQQNIVSPVPNNESTYATKEDLNSLRAEMDRFRNRIDAIANKKEQRKEYKNG